MYYYLPELLPIIHTKTIIITATIKMPTQTPALKMPPITEQELTNTISEKQSARS